MNIWNCWLIFHHFCEEVSPTGQKSDIIRVGIIFQLAFPWQKLPLAARCAERDIRKLIPRLFLISTLSKPAGHELKQPNEKIYWTRAQKNFFRLIFFDFSNKIKNWYLKMCWFQFFDEWLRKRAAVETSVAWDEREWCFVEHRRPNRSFGASRSHTMTKRVNQVLTNHTSPVSWKRGQTHKIQWNLREIDWQKNGRCSQQLLVLFRFPFYSLLS